MSASRYSCRSWEFPAVCVAGAKSPCSLLRLSMGFFVPSGPRSAVSDTITVGVALTNLSFFSDGTFPYTCFIVAIVCCSMCSAPKGLGGFNYPTSIAHVMQKRKHTALRKTTLLFRNGVSPNLAQLVTPSLLGVCLAQGWGTS